MQGPELLETFVLPLENHGLRYMISGSVASTIYGEPRSTVDIDLAVFPSGPEADRFTEFYPDTEFYLPPRDVIRLECAREVRGHFNIIHLPSGFKADIYPSRSHPYLAWALQNRRRINAGGHEVWLVPPEYLIMLKLDFYREGGSSKHLRDLAGIAEQQTLDLPLLQTALSELSLTSEWNQVLDLVNR